MTGGIGGSHRKVTTLGKRNVCNPTCPPKSILTRPLPPTTIVSNTSPLSSHLSPNAPSFTPISSTQEEINDLKNSRVVIESKLDQLTGHIQQFISSIGGASLEQADSASSN
ncbi:hypothetical protein RIR_jg14430.t1 [Rhizophagus irregularis DAOM 181602=DAOM 197198]|uniref:Uncharacterized protein n=1 Tax=Rhizophagus irregularis (strain DAOM 197198w) TaxID=1432141 RepID=A0A015NH90_RHIIW|nr:hypothetical protein RirG_012150 [Rhizophagus irregularis DAOM 197198w]GBC22344.2 hypothetical protein RIR_jg14430.t1 [Rhizophagus irregularis DAOM 181602=DAOM 197198]